MRQLDVHLGNRSYPIFVHNGLLNGKADFLKPFLDRDRLFIITDTTVDKLYGDIIRTFFADQSKPAIVLPIQPGESSKSLRSAEKLYDSLVEHRATRKSMVIAFGGGVVGDLAGFVAATFMRGVAFAQIPTTVLSQVDSSVGGKVGINHIHAKNLIGAFYQPDFVVIDPLVLKTLTLRHVRSGLAEIIKTALIGDAALFERLTTCFESFESLEDADLNESIIHACCKIKAGVVEEDEREYNKRAVLNFGHTIGHALESVTAYCQFYHGEAVSLGMLAALYLSKKQGLSSTHYRIAVDLVQKLQPPGIPPTISAYDVINSIKNDKKRQPSGQIWVLLKAIASPVLAHDLSQQEVLETIKLLLSREIK